MKKIIWFFIFMIGKSCFSQSYHFSQFYATPLLVNPAFTGYTDGTVRAAANYRTQWGSSHSPYKTMSASIEFSPLRGKLEAGNKLGLGFSYLSDQSLEGAVKANSINFSAAYNQVLDQDQIHTIGVGLQGAYHERIIDFSKLTFENQLTSSGFDPSLPRGETLDEGKRSYMDINAGILYNARLEGKEFFVGASMFNILQKNKTFLPENYKMPVRYGITAGGSFETGEAGFLSFSTHAQFQQQANEVTIGSAYAMILGASSNKMLSAGLWYRINDAVIPYLSYDINGLRVGFSYDYTLSQIKTASQSRNGMEFSLVYSQKDNSEQKRLIPWY